MPEPTTIPLSADGQSGTPQLFKAVACFLQPCWYLHTARAHRPMPASSPLCGIECQRLMSVIGTFSGVVIAAIAQVPK
jgi:hypothetical protein